MEEILTQLWLGAYIFFCLDVIIKMTSRIINYEDYTPWQRHIYGCATLFMLFIILQLIWDATTIFYHIEYEESTISHYVGLFSLLNLQFAGIILFSITSHQSMSVKRFCYHIPPFIILILLSCFLESYIPWITYCLYILEVCYCILTFIICYRSALKYKKYLHQIYADIHRRNLDWMRNLIWLFSIAAGLFYYFCYMETKMDFMFYPLIISTFYYFNSQILRLRETKELDDFLSIESEKKTNALEESVETNTTEEEKISMREATKRRIEETLEDVCLNKRLYLNPDLTVNDLAMELHTNRTYISQYFADHHTTFLKYINDLRAEYAMYQIKNTNHKLSIIMEYSGFRHVETFRRAFSSRYNCNPKDVLRNGNTKMD